MRNRILSALLIVALLFSLAACQAPSGAESQPPDPQDASSASGGTEQEVSWDDKYDPPITLDVVLSLPQASHAEITDPYQTSLFQLAEEVLGIKLNIVWSLPPDQYDQKFNLSISTGDLPDVFSVPFGSAAVYNDLAESGAIWEIGHNYDEYLHPDLLAYYQQADVAEYKSQVESVGGTSYSYANVYDSKCNTPYWYVRKDYLDKLGLDVPETIEELMDAAVKMSEAGLGTLGIAGGSDGSGFVTDAWGSMVPFFNSFGAYPSTGQWLEQDGALVSGVIQPEVRDGLLALQDLYKRGGLDMDFASKNSGNFTEDVLSGKIGIFSGVWWHAAFPLTSMVSDESECEWIALPVLPSEKIKEPKTSSTPFVASHFNMVSKDCEHPEALAKLLSLDYELQVNGVTRWGAEKAVDTYENNWKAVWLTTSLYDVEHDSAFRVANAETKEDAKKVIEEPLNQGSANLTIALNSIYNYVWEDSKADWGWYFSRAPLDSGLGLTERLYEENLVQTNPYVGPTLAADIEKGAALLTARNEAFVRIIMGDSIDTFDQFVENWKKNGGDEMAKEATAWFQNR